MFATTSEAKMISMTTFRAINKKWQSTNISKKSCPILNMIIILSEIYTERNIKKAANPPD